MIATARAHGMLVMAGCMIETSLGITAAAHFAPLLDYADFDGAALLADDPYVGATIDGGRIAIPTRRGSAFGFDKAGLATDRHGHRLTDTEQRDHLRLSRGSLFFSGLRGCEWVKLGRFAMI